MRRLWFALLLVPSLAVADTTVDSAKLFGTKSFRLKEDAAVAQMLEQVGAWLKADRSRVVRIEVHADDALGMVDNTLLASKRAKVLVKQVKKAGGSGKQVLSDAVGHSAVQPTSATSRIVFVFRGDEPKLTTP